MNLRGGASSYDYNNATIYHQKRETLRTIEFICPIIEIQKDATEEDHFSSIFASRMHLDFNRWAYFEYEPLGKGPAED